MSSLIGGPCSIPDCDKPCKRATDYCPGHLHRLHRYGSPTGMPESRLPRDATEKRCTRCKVTKLLSEFGSMKHAQLGLRPKCRACEAEVARVRRRDESLEQKDRRLGRRRNYKRYQYGGKAAETWRKVVDSGQGCMVCGAVDEDICVDHDHSCREGHSIKSGCDKCFRGILCASCNGALGLVRDDPDRLLALAGYLLRWRGGDENDRIIPDEGASSSRC